MQNDIQTPDVLLFQTDSFNAVNYGIILEQFRCRATIAHTVQEFFNFFKTKNPALAIFSLYIPHGSELHEHDTTCYTRTGIVLYRWIRENHDFPIIPVIITTTAFDLPDELDVDDPHLTVFTSKNNHNRQAHVIRSAVEIISRAELALVQ